jgi:hypothetical protein
VQEHNIANPNDKIHVSVEGASGESDGEHAVYLALSNDALGKLWSAHVGEEVVVGGVFAVKPVAAVAAFKVAKLAVVGAAAAVHTLATDMDMKHDGALWLKTKSAPSAAARRPAACRAAPPCPPSLQRRP